MLVRINRVPPTPSAVRLAVTLATRFLEAGLGATCGRPEQGHSARIAILCIYISDVGLARSLVCSDRVRRVVSGLAGLCPGFRPRARVAEAQR
eukprot:8964009-Lingulodinium_polyedra.AAC.1